MATVQDEASTVTVDPNLTQNPAAADGCHEFDAVAEGQDRVINEQIDAEVLERLERIRETLRVQRDTALDPEHMLVKDHHATQQDMSVGFCWQRTQRLWRQKRRTVAEYWSICMWAARSLDLRREDNKRINRSKVSETIGNSRKDFQQMRRTNPIKAMSLATAYNYSKLFTQVALRQLDVVICLSSESTQFIKKHTAAITEIVTQEISWRHERSSLDMGSGQGSQVVADEQPLRNFVRDVTWPDRNAVDHKRLWQQLRRRRLVPFPMLSQRFATLTKNGEPISLPCLIECNLQHAGFGTVQVVALLVYVDAEHAESRAQPEDGDPCNWTESDEKTQQSACFDPGQGEVWVRKASRDGKSTPARGMVFHCIQSIVPFQAGIERRLLGAVFSSLKASVMAFEPCATAKQCSPWKTWHLHGRPELALEHVLTSGGFRNHSLLQQPLQMAGKDLPYSFRDLLATQCLMECNELECQKGADCTHHFSTVPTPLLKGVMSHFRLIDSANPMEEDDSVDNRVWFDSIESVGEYLDMLHRPPCVVDPAASREIRREEYDVDAKMWLLPLIDRMNQCIRQAYSAPVATALQWSIHGLRPSVEMINDDLDVQTLLCFFPPTHMHKRAVLTNGNTLLYALEPWSKAGGRMLRAWRGHHAYWQARLHYFEVSPATIQSCSWLQSMLAEQAVDQTIWKWRDSIQWREAEAMEMQRGVRTARQKLQRQRHVPPAGTGTGPSYQPKFAHWVKGQVSSKNIGNHLFILRCDARRDLTQRFDLPVTERPQCLQLLSDDLLHGITHPLYEIIRANDNSLQNLCLFVELIAWNRPPWEDKVVRDVLERFRTAAYQAVMPLDEHRFYLSTQVADTAGLHSSVLIHTNICVSVDILRIVHALLMRSMPVVNEGNEPVQYDWDSTLVVPKQGEIVCPMVNTQSMINCPDCTAEREGMLCRYNCSEGWLHQPGVYRLLSVVSSRGTLEDIELKNMRESVILQWQKLSILLPPNFTICQLRSSIPWIASLGYGVQRPRVGAATISSIDRRRIKLGRELPFTMLDDTEFQRCPRDHKCCAQLHRLCDALRLVGQDAAGYELIRCSMSGLPTSRTIGNHLSVTFMLHFQVASHTTCPVSSALHREPYHVLVLLSVNGSISICNHPRCVLKSATAGVRRKYRSFDDKYVAASYLTQNRSALSMDVFEASQYNGTEWSLLELMEEEAVDAKLRPSAENRQTVVE